MRFRSAVLMIVLAAPSLAADAPTTNSDFKPDPASVRRFGPAYRYPQDGWIVLHIEGSPYERGFQHGKLMSGEIADYVSTLAKGRSTSDPAAAWNGTRTLVSALFLRKYDPEYLEEMKGIADGAASAGAKIFGRSVDLLDIAATNSELETSSLDGALEALPTGLESGTFREPKTARDKPEQAEHCSAFAATGPATADGKIVFGHITMFALYNVRHFNVWLDIKPEKGHRVLMQTFPGGIHSGMDYYQNDHGMLLTETTIGQTKFGENAAPLASRIRKVIQYADTIDDAVKLLTEANNGLYTNEWLLGDTNTNEIAMFELGTNRTKLWRSSKDEFPGGTQGFYWGCNNAKDLEVRLDAVAAVDGKPANVTFRTSDRDRKWVELYERNKGKIGLAFGFEAFTTPPLAAFPSCDAKFTTSDMAKELKCIAIFGPPRGKTWEPSDGERSRFKDIRPLVSNDWTILKVDSPAPQRSETKDAVDIAGDGDKFTVAIAEDRLIRPAAWHGTILPSDPKDLWLASAFSDYEKYVSLERALKGDDGKLSKAAEERLGLAMFVHRERVQSASRRLGRVVSARNVDGAEMAKSEPFDIVSGKGVLFLHWVRGELGAATFDAMMERFGRAHAGKAATTAEFLAEAKAEYSVQDASPKGKIKTANFEAQCKVGLEYAGRPIGDGPDWSIDAFDSEPDKALIVYGTLRDAHAQREAATILQDRIARRWGNYTVAIKSDRDVTEDDLASNHLLLIGRPATSNVASRFAASMPVAFGPASFRISDATYAHAGSAIVAAGPNPLASSRYAMIVFAGLGADSTRSCVAKLFDRGSGSAPAMLMPAGGEPRPILLPSKAKPATVAGTGD